jgi:hypothetical protein
VVTELLHQTYLPFTPEQLLGHFAPVGTDTTSAERHLAYYAKSAQAAANWGEHPLSGKPAEVAKAQKHGLQIQKDERFWVVTALMSAFHTPDRVAMLAAMLRRCLGVIPPIEGLTTWEQALGDARELGLYFEVSLPSPAGYRDYLASRLHQRVLVPHVLSSATRTAAAGRALEGATKVDAVLIAPGTGVAVLFEAKVLADASCAIGFDILRNQITRNIDVMLDPNPRLQHPLSLRRPGRTCFVLITPRLIKDHPESRLYGWLMRNYQDDPAALHRDMPHRTGTDFIPVARRLGWLTWEDFNDILPGACKWLPLPAAELQRDGDDRASAPGQI